MSGRKCAECGEIHLAGANGAIYCCGALLGAVQLSGMFADSKTFVDMCAKYLPERILADFQLFSACKKNEGSLKHLCNFVENHFDPPGMELEAWNPPDWRSEPQFLKNVQDPELKRFGASVHAIWKNLGRRIKDCVRTNPLMYSLVYLPNPFIVPGGRFGEFYYWDTYWIVRGLLYSGMPQTARGMIDNLLGVVQNYQFVPSGGRIYYWGRSQPPLLIRMISTYVELTNDERYALQALPVLDMEMENFIKNHAVQVENRLLYQYRDKSSGPRPEAYREDVARASSYGEEEAREEHYSHIKAACESGMNFSSRWFISAIGNNVGTLSDTKANYIVPVDLNAMVFRNFKYLSLWYRKAGNTAKADLYQQRACALIKAIRAILWNEEMGVWLDYDLLNKQPRNYFVVTNLSPLWHRAFPINDVDKLTDSIMRYIEENELDSYPGGVPTTLSNTGQQWDYPNVWPPMMHMLIEGLNNLGTPQAIEMSKRWCDRWVKANYTAFRNSNAMYDKYNCEVLGGKGIGGEYDCQCGYGWTNGVIIELLAKYGAELSVSDGDECAECCEPTNILAMESCPITSEAYMEKCDACGEKYGTADQSQNQGEDETDINQEGSSNSCACSCEMANKAENGPESNAELELECACSCEVPINVENGTQTDQQEKHRSSGAESKPQHILAPSGESPLQTGTPVRKSADYYYGDSGIASCVSKANFNNTTNNVTNNTTTNNNNDKNFTCACGVDPYRNPLNIERTQPFPADPAAGNFVVTKAGQPCDSPNCPSQVSYAPQVSCPLCAQQTQPPAPCPMHAPNQQLSCQTSTEPPAQQKAPTCPFYPQNQQTSCQSNAQRPPFQYTSEQPTSGRMHCPNQQMNQQNMQYRQAPQAQSPPCPHHGATQASSNPCGMPINAPAQYAPQSGQPCGAQAGPQNGSQPAPQSWQQPAPQAKSQYGAQTGPQSGQPCGQLGQPYALQSAPPSAACGPQSAPASGPCGNQPAPQSWQPCENQPAPQAKSQYGAQTGPQSGQPCGQLGQPYALQSAPPSATCGTQSAPASGPCGPQSASHATSPCMKQNAAPPENQSVCRDVSAKPLGLYVMNSNPPNQNQSLNCEKGCGKKNGEPSAELEDSSSMPQAITRIFPLADPLSVKCVISSEAPEEEEKGNCGCPAEEPSEEASVKECD
ncbi:Treh [Drosophila busckii]|uniref:Trehalase n=1 Tax=Drosophila busckii TaxID=30019 RepID=A0A0M4EV49_DROBS|nr:uncharacterized protein LOC108597476 [Drosophila busckii]ALC41687.1 Treh [Drosophila busckii]